MITTTLRICHGFSFVMVKVPSLYAPLPWKANAVEPMGSSASAAGYVAKDVALALSFPPPQTTNYPIARSECTS